MEKTKGELLQEELMMKPVNGTTRLSDEELDKAYAYAEDYKAFMDAAKIEIEAVKEAIKKLEANGYHEFERGKKYQPGERFYYNNRAGSLALEPALGVTVYCGCNKPENHLSLRIKLWIERKRGFRG